MAPTPPADSPRPPAEPSDALNGATPKLHRATRDLFGMLWRDYCGRVPDAPHIESALRSRGERWTEDHVAFRTLPGSPCTAETLAFFFGSLGYQKQDTYRFHDKRLNAFWMAPPTQPSTLAWDAPPKVFISELDVASFPQDQRQQLEDAIAKAQKLFRPAPAPWTPEVPLETFLAKASQALVFEPRATALDFETYLNIRSFSEYGAWTLVYGPCINHFTVSVHLMDGFASLSALNDHLKNTLQIQLNTTGGSEIKGSPKVDLEQSATIAAPFQVAFSDGTQNIPYAFVEFAFRYLVPRDADKRLWHSYFQGFVEGNADRIFSSTDLRS